VHYHHQQHRRLSSLSQQHYNNDKLMMNMPIIDERFTSNHRDFSSVNSSSINVKSHTFQSISTNAHPIILHSDQNRLSFLAAAHAARTIDNTTYNQISIFQRPQTQIPSNLSKDNHYKIFSEICSLFHINIYRILIISMILIWSLDETNFLFLTDLLKSSGQSEQRSTLLIAITGIADLIGQLFFGYKTITIYEIILIELFNRYLGDIECINPFILWTCTSVIAGLALSLAPLVGSFGIIGLCILFAIHAFFLAAPNALGNVIMIEVVGMHRYAIAYGFSLLASGSTSFVGYPLLGELNK
jgi:hypothetical protein